jgi:hypothetical protein
LLIPLEVWFSGIEGQYTPKMSSGNVSGNLDVFQDECLWFNKKILLKATKSLSMFE